MKRKVELSCEVVNYGAIARNVSGQRQLAKWLLQYALEKGLIADPRKETSFNGEKAKVLQMRCGSDSEKLCAGI